MLSTVSKRLAFAALFALCTIALAGNKPPRYLNEPLLGLRLDAGAKLDLVPEALRVLCKRVPEDDTSIARFWIFAQASDAGISYYVVSGYSEVRNPETGATSFDPIVRGGLYIVTGNKCDSDPADEYFEGPTDEVPLPILQQLSRDLAARLVRAVGGADKLRTEIKNQRIDFDALSPELQVAFKPYFSAAK
jgi:hypothetical protein